MLRRSLLPLALILLAGILVVVVPVLLPAEKAQAPVAPVILPEGFQDRKVVDAEGATALAFTPDGRLLITNRIGQLLVHKQGASTTTTALDISNKVCSNSERGLLGVAVDPDFAANGHVYLYYTFNRHNVVCPERQPQSDTNPVNRVSRFTMNGDGVVQGSEKVLIDNIPSPNGNHNAGDLRFGKDGKLYISTGDGACDYAEPTKCQPENDASRDRNVLLGKILRINPDGTIPADNPYANATDGVRCATLTGSNAAGGSAAAPGKICKETFAMGFRNPFRFTMDPNAAGTSLRVNDVGGARIEEVSQVRSGADYGWNCREGTLVLNTSAPCPGRNMVGPIHEYSHDTGCSSITGAAFVPNDAGWPASYNHAYLYGDYVCGKIFGLKPDGNGGFARTVFATGLKEQGPGPVSMTFGPSGSGKALYYTTYAGGGQVHRISYVVGNKTPTADVQADKTYGATPLEVTFDGSGSTDPDAGDTLKYEWDFTNDGTVDATGVTASHTYDTRGTFTAALTVTDGKDFSDTAQVTVYAGNTAPPEPVIKSPTEGKLFRVGEQIRLSGSATDADDGQIPADKLSFEVIQHHTAPNGHTHPYQKVAGASGTFTAPAPEDLRSTNPAGNYVEIKLTATDSQGLSKTVSRDLKPRTTSVIFGTRPAEFYLFLNGSKFRAPRTLLSWEGYRLNVYAPPQTHDGQRWVFGSWSDGRGDRHTIVTPQDQTRYTATFERE